MTSKDTTFMKRLEGRIRFENSVTLKKKKSLLQTVKVVKDKDIWVSYIRTCASQTLFPRSDG